MTPTIISAWRNGKNRARALANNENWGCGMGSYSFCYFSNGKFSKAEKKDFRDDIEVLDAASKLPVTTEIVIWEGKYRFVARLNEQSARIATKDIAAEFAATRYAAGTKNPSPR